MIKDKEMLNLKRIKLNSKDFFGVALKIQIDKTPYPIEIGRWAYNIFYFLYICKELDDMDEGLGDVMLALTLMAYYPQQRLSVEELYELANDLYEGREVKIKLDKDLFRDLIAKENKHKLVELIGWV